MNDIQMKILSVLDTQPAPIATRKIIHAMGVENARTMRADEFAFSLAELEADGLVEWSGDPRRWALTTKGMSLMMERQRVLDDVRGGPLHG